MDVATQPDLPPPAAATTGGSELGEVVVKSAAAAPPPRLPSISALLNNVSSPGTASDRTSAPPTSLPPCGSFDKPPRPTNSNYFSTPLSPISHSPPTPASNSQPSSSEFPPVATASPATADEAGKADSRRDKPHDNPAVPTRQLASVEFPDGNALHPLPSGLSGGRNSITSAVDPSLRPRSNSISYPAVYELPSFARLSHGYQSFATSSERGGGAGGGPPDERPSFSGAFESVDPFFRHPAVGGSPGRPRALSISTTDEYRAWPADAAPHLRQQHHAFVPHGAAELVGLRRGSAPGPRLAFVMEQPGGPSAASSSAAAQVQAQAQAQAQAHAQAQAAQGRAITFPPPTFAQHHHRWNGHHPPSAPPHPLAGQAPTIGGSSALLPPPAAPSGLGLLPLSIPSGLPLTSPLSPPNMSPVNPTPVSAPPALGTGGWGALPGRPGPPPSGQLAQDLAFGVDPATAAAQAGAAAAAGGSGEAGASEPGRYICPHCTKRFARPSSLRIHMHSHTGEKPFSCHLCDRAFSVQSNLRRHLKIHKGGHATSSAPSGPNGSRRGERIAREQQARAATAAAAATVAAGANGEEDAEGEMVEDEEMGSGSDGGGSAG